MMSPPQLPAQDGAHAHAGAGPIASSSPPQNASQKASHGGPSLLTIDIGIIGAGSAGLSVAAGAAQLGARTLLIERDKMGGDCLNYGCVPSKALIAAADKVAQIRQATQFGIKTGPVSVDFQAVMRHVSEVIATIAPHDSVERFEALGVRVLRGTGSFTAPTQVKVGEQHIKAKYWVIATGARAAIPPIPGLDTVAYLTNQTIFTLDHCPAQLLIIGAGPIGLELAQAFQRLGSSVTVIERFTLLPKDDLELVQIIRQNLLSEGIKIVENAQITAVQSLSGGVSLTLADGQKLVGSHLLLAAGRRANVESLNLAAAGIMSSARGIVVDQHLRTHNKRVFAIGDVAEGAPQFTHSANYQAGLVIRQALFRLPAKADWRYMPWVSYTDPELAQLGLHEAAARAAGHEVTIWRWPMAQNDRAIAERCPQGLIKLVVEKGGRVLGVSIIGAQAGELLQSWAPVIEGRVKLRHLASQITAYPTLSEVNKRVAASYFSGKIFGPKSRALVKALLKLP
jgi:pyruvate/2-oxoglutarate dehydrogenase complex dihydrolipoamide dehydrogenase (E3) component